MLAKISFSIVPIQFGAMMLSFITI